MTDTSTLSGYLLDYYVALAENMPNPRLKKHEREDTYICCIDGGIKNWSWITTYSPTTNPAMALPIVDMMLLNSFYFRSSPIGNYINCLGCGSGHGTIPGKDITEAALRALVAWKFPNGLPEPIYESEK